MALLLPTGPPLPASYDKIHTRPQALPRPVWLDLDCTLDTLGAFTIPMLGLHSTQLSQMLLG